LNLDVVVFAGLDLATSPLVGGLLYNIISRLHDLNDAKFKYQESQSSNMKITASIG
jgi:hypothetical protein